jgi:hypothetical protein
LQKYTTSPNSVRFQPPCRAPDEAAPAKRLAHLPRPAGGEKGAQSKQLQQKARRSKWSYRNSDRTMQAGDPQREIDRQAQPIAVSIGRSL